MKGNKKTPSLCLEVSFGPSGKPRRLWKVQGFLLNASRAADKKTSHMARFLHWCKWGDLNPHEVALSGF